MWDVDDALTVTGLAKSYGERRAADGVTFSAAAGRITAVLGPNGAGKTTTSSAARGCERRTPATSSCSAGAGGTGRTTAGCASGWA